MSEPCEFFYGETCGQVGDHRCEPRIAHVTDFFIHVLVHTKGDYAGQPFVPAPWQRTEILEPLFGQVVWDAGRGRYVRHYRTFYLLVARKNGKSELLAGLTLYLLSADGEQGAELYGLAMDIDQASVVFATAKRMVELSAELSAGFNTYETYKSIQNKNNRQSVYRIIAGDAPGALGLNPHGAYIDELLTQPNRDLYDAIRTGMGTRAEPLLMLATTAENDPAGFAATERAWSERVLEDPDLDPRRLVVIHAADAEDDWTQPATWHKANPALGDFLDVSVLAAECHTAQGNPADERAFRQYRLNQPQGAVGRAVNLTTWDDAGHPLPDLAGRECFAGLDLAATSDLATYALDFPIADGAHAVIWRHFCPSAQLPNLDRRTGGRATVWAADGLLTVTEGNVIDYEAILATLEIDRGLYTITEIGYDPWGAAMLRTRMEESGMPTFPVRQGVASMAGPMAEFLRLIAAGLYHHGGNPLVRWQAGNLVTRSDPAGNLKPDRQRSADKIDGIVAGLMALDRASRHQQPEPEPSYATAGFS